MAAHDANGKSNSQNKPSNDPDLFDQLQDEFDALLAGAELPDKQENVQANELTSPADPVLQDTSEFLSTADMLAFDMPSDEPAEPAVETVMPENVGEAIASGNKTTDDSSDLDAANKIFLQESDLSDTGHAEQASPQLNQQQTMPDNQTPDPDGIDQFPDEMNHVALAEKAPVHPDMTDDQAPQSRSGSRHIIIAGFIVLAIAGGIYWLVGGVQEQPEQIASTQEQAASSQKQSIPETAAKQAELPDSPSVSPIETRQSPATVQKAKTVKASIQREAVEKAKAKLLAKEQATAKRSAEKVKAAELAAKQTAEKRAQPKK